MKSIETVTTIQASHQEPEKTKSTYGDNPIQTQQLPPSDKPGAKSTDVHPKHASLQPPPEAPQPSPVEILTLQTVKWQPCMMQTNDDPDNQYRQQGTAS